MYIYKFTVECEQEFHGHLVHDVSEHYLAAYAYEHAQAHVQETLSKGGWKIKNISGKEIFLLDIRDKCDRVTDELNGVKL